MNLILTYFSIKYKGDFIKIYNALKNKEIVDPADIDKLEEQIESGNLKVFTILDEEYPESLKIIGNPPFVLFYKGNLSLLNKSALCLTGDNQDQKSIEYVEQAIQETAKNNVLITNYIAGSLDENIVKKHYDQKQNIIFVSPNGLEDPYFSKEFNLDIEKDLIISEYPSGVNVTKGRIKERNRITASLSDAIIAFNSEKDGLVSNLVSYFLEQGKEIYCYPGQEIKDGNNLLIQDGANLITSIKDVNCIKSEEKNTLNIKEESIKEELAENQYFSIFLSEKNIKKEYDKQFLISMPKLGLIYIPKSTTLLFSKTNKQTGEISEWIRLSFNLSHNYKLFNKKQNESTETPLIGEELYESLKAKSDSKEIYVGLTLHQNKIVDSNELSEKAKSKKLEEGMEM